MMASNTIQVYSHSFNSPRWVFLCGGYDSLPWAQSRRSSTFFSLTSKPSWSLCKAVKEHGASLRGVLKEQAKTESHTTSVPTELIELSYVTTHNCHRGWEVEPSCVSRKIGGHRFWWTVTIPAIICKTIWLFKLSTCIAHCFNCGFVVKWKSRQNRGSC